MVRNQKNQSAAVRLGPALMGAVLCILIGGSGVGYVWHKNQIYILAQAKKKCENRLEELRRQNKLCADHLAYLRLPWVLEGRIKELKLGLGPPLPEQVLHLTEPPSTFPLGAITRQYVAQPERSQGTP